MTNSLRCLFVWPRANSLMAADNWAFYGSLAVATHARECGAAVQIVDRRRAEGVTCYPQAAANADLIFVSATTADLPDANEAIRIAKEQGRYVVIGGVHATAVQNPFKDFLLADSAVRGDGMAVIAQLLEDWKRGAPKRVYVGPAIGKSVVTNLDIHIPDRSLLPDQGKQHPLSLVTEMGCPNKCSFCFDANTGTHRRDPEQVVREIAKTGNNSFFANFDDNILGADPEGARSLARAIRDSKLEPRWFGNADITCMFHRDILAELRQAGMASIYIGFETIFTPSLKRSGKATLVMKLLRSGFLGKTYDTITDELIFELYKKVTEELHSIGFTVYCGLIFGWPEEHAELIERVIEFGTTVPDVPWLSIVTPYPGTGIRHYFEREKIAMKPYSSGLYDTNHLVFEHPLLSERELYDTIGRFYAISGSPEVRAQKARRLEHPRFASWARSAVDSNLSAMRIKASALYFEQSDAAKQTELSSFSLGNYEHPRSLI